MHQFIFKISYLQNLPQQLPTAWAFAKAKCVFLCICLSNIFAEVIAFKQNIFISVKLFLWYLRKRLLYRNKLFNNVLFTL